MSTYFERVRLEHEARALARRIAELRERLRELEDALRLVSEERVRSAYRIFGGVIAIEIDPSRARDVIEEEIALTRSAIAALEKRLREIEERLRGG